ncbi:hypothetical protein M9Y10_035249 [Tritrichomonas musculus]|uniref:Uncharacterized protein n=1 Tax=Tritrichomonas musculus TaxID=1915356 RepID=A0ABR2KHP8_9EUKA
MSSLPFKRIYGYNFQPQNDCDKLKIEISYPSKPEISDLYQKLIDICADPQSLLELLNNQISNHVRSGTPDHFVNFKLSQMLNPFFTILPFILSDRSLIAQAHDTRINVKKFLSQWQYFAFQSIFIYFTHILSSKIYIGEARQWLITTIFELLCQNKTVYSHSIVTRVRIKDKAFKDKLVLHAVIKPNHEITIYSHNTCVKKGILKYQSDADNLVHQIEEYTKDKLSYQARIVLLESDGDKITADSAEHFFSEGLTINHLIWACLATKENNFSYEAFYSIAKMIIGLDGQFLQIFYYSNPIEGLFKSLMKVAIFIHRHTFLLKTLIWAIFDEAKDLNKIFKSSFPPIKYLIAFVKEIIKPQTNCIVNQLIEYISAYQNDFDNLSTDDLLNDHQFKKGIIERFWDLLDEASLKLPKSLFDICFHLRIFSEMYSPDQNEKSYIYVKDLIFNESLIPLLIDFMRDLPKIYKDILNFVIKTVTMTTTLYKQNEYSLLGIDNFQKILVFISQSSELNISDIEMPTILEFINSVKNLIDCIKGSADYIRKITAPNDKKINISSSSSSSCIESTSITFSDPQLPILKKRRSSKHTTGTSILLKDSDTSTCHFQMFKEIPSNIIPWKYRIAHDIFYSYYYELKKNQ